MSKVISHPYAPTTKICNSLSRNFAYTLSDKKATTNLLKAAEREPIDVEEKQKCILYNLSVGAYVEIIVPFLKELNAGKISEGGLFVDSVTPGHDEKGRHIDTVVQFTLNGLKTTVCFYNTTQRVKLEGKGYLNFSTYLSEFLRKKVNEIPEKIDNYNKAVIAALSGKRKAVSRPIRSVRYKSVVQIKCDKCNITFNSNSQLIIHMKSSHTQCKQTINVDDQSKIPMIDDLSFKHSLGT